MELSSIGHRLDTYLLSSFRIPNRFVIGQLNLRCSILNESFGCLSVFAQMNCLSKVCSAFAQTLLHISYQIWTPRSSISCQPSVKTAFFSCCLYFLLPKSDTGLVLVIAHSHHSTFRRGASFSQAQCNFFVFRNISGYSKLNFVWDICIFFQ